MVLDRPNPNGFYIDGPILEKPYRSFVGMQPVPVVYGMTIGEYAKMLLCEKWLNTNLCSKTIIIFTRRQLALFVIGFCSAIPYHLCQV